MQSLSKAMAGDACTVKWMFGVPELLRYLRANHIEEGSAIQVVQNCWGNMIVEAAACPTGPVGTFVTNDT